MQIALQNVPSQSEFGSKDPLCPSQKIPYVPSTRFESEPPSIFSGILKFGISPLNKGVEVNLARR